MTERLDAAGTARPAPARSEYSGAAAAEDAAGPAAASESPGTVDVLVTRLDHGLPLPSYAHPGDAGADLRTAVDAVVQPGERALLPTGVALALPEGYAAFVHPRSGLAVRYGVALVNSPGTVDAGYRGEVKVIVVNLDRNAPVVFHRGDRIAQLVVQRVERARFREVAELPDTARGAGGFGSTGR